MGTLIEAYERVSKRVSELNERAMRTQSEISRLSASFMGDTSGRIAKLTQQLEKIDKYLLEIKGFQDLAQKYMDTQNVLTIEAPPGYRVNMNRLRNWAMMIDPTSTNDPYAQRVYITAKCDQMFLERKQAEFMDRIAMLKADQAVGTSLEIEELKKKLAGIRASLKAYAMGREISEFARQVVAENSRFWLQDVPAAFKNAGSVPAAIAPGAFAAPLSFEPEQRKMLKAAMEECYDEAGGRVRLPVELGNQTPYVMAVDCTPVKRKALDRALQHLILTTIHENPAGTRKVYVLDGTRFNAACLGSLRQLEGTYVLEQIPRNPDQLTAVLEQIVSSFSDMDELLDLHDSVAEYNSGVEENKRLPMSTVIAIGWPEAYSPRDRELIRRMMTNYERYGISFVTVSYSGAEKKEGTARGDMPEYALQNAVHIRMLKDRTTVAFADGAEQFFVWYTFTGTLPYEYVDSLLKRGAAKETLGSEYTRRIDMEQIPPYERGKKSIVLPYGVDSKDTVHELAFDNENFAAYLMGASGSGKSTLLHTLITGIIRNYHPDDVELWLADFKMSEFAQYIDPMPPHIKYILLDESRELVFDLIDKLTEKMMERQRFFMQAENRNYKKVENVPSRIYMPVIFVILDEFSIMSQAVYEAEAYKLKLQNLLAKGRALGIKFIFSSQTFTTGVMGLTKTAKEQIQMRIAMKNSPNEIAETLELSSGTKTTQVRNWIDALPPHFALTKYREEDKMYVKRVNVMYFPGKGDTALEPQRRLIRHLNRSMTPVPAEEYDPGRPDRYVDKQPVVVDGNTFEAFDAQRCMEENARLMASNLYNGDEIFAYVGSPRLMYTMKEIAVTPESRQNLLVLGDASERSCGASVITSVMESFRMQGKAVEIWAYDRDKIYRALCGSTWESYPAQTDLGEICNKIFELKNALQESETEEKLIVLLGFENICADFEFVLKGAKQPAPPAAGGGASSAVLDALSSAAVKEDGEDEESAKLREQLLRLQRETASQEDGEEDDDDGFVDMSSLDFDALVRAQQAVLSVSQPETGAGEKAAETPASVEADAAEAEAAAEVPAEEAAEGEAASEDDGRPGVYNAREDLKFCVQQGSRRGVHFLAYFSSHADLKQTGLKLEWFRHRLSFRQSSDDSKLIFNTNAAALLPGHICLYSDMLERFSFRPYLHRGISWDGWGVDSDGRVLNPLTSNE